MKNKKLLIKRFIKEQRKYQKQLMFILDRAKSGKHLYPKENGDINLSTIINFIKFSKIKNPKKLHNIFASAHYYRSKYSLPIRKLVYRILDLDSKDWYFYFD